MILSIAGPQDSIFDPKTNDGKNIDILYKSIYHAASYSKVKPGPINPGEADTVSSWTSSIVSRVVTDLNKDTTLTPDDIYRQAILLKESFPDGDAGTVDKTLTGAKVTFSLAATSASSYLFLDKIGELKSTKVLTTPVPQPIFSCFVGSSKQDHYYLTIQSQDGLLVKGKISISNSQKDSSSGTFSGTFDGTILTGLYTFSSEGVQSERELFFKVDGENILQGFSPVEEKSNIVQFVRPLIITWDNSYLLKYSKNCR